jgi:hypothetical protein
MKKTLLSILFAGLNLVSAVAGPLELNTSLISEGGEYYSARKVMTTKKGYTIDIDASAYKTKNTNALQRSLSFVIDDNTTRVHVVDANANGLSKDDFFVLQHKFRNGDNLFINVDYRGNSEYKIDAEITGVENRNANTKIETAKLNPAINSLAKKKVKPLIDFSQRLYSNLVDAAENNREPELPYEEVKAVLNQIEPYLAEGNASRRKLEFGILRLGNRYLELAEQKNKDFERKGK